jgi:hypothetical protein
MISIRPYQDSDWPALWPLLRNTFKTGDTYAFSPESTEADIHNAWVDVPMATYVACADDGRLLGTYLLKRSPSSAVKSFTLKCFLKPSRSSVTRGTDCQVVLSLISRENSFRVGSSLRSVTFQKNSCGNMAESRRICFFSAS